MSISNMVHKRGCHVALAALDREIDKISARQSKATGAEITRWQAEGLMPERDGGVLVWKHVVKESQYWCTLFCPSCPWAVLSSQDDSELLLCVECHRAFRRGDIWTGNRGGTYYIGLPYQYGLSMVGAGPYGVLAEYAADNSFKPPHAHILAILADKGRLQAAITPSPGVFYAPRGLPVAVYEATRVNADEFDLKLVQSHEGMDPLEWIMPATGCCVCDS